MSAKKEWDRKLAMELYTEGRNDAEIGRACGVSSTSVRMWRNKIGLVPNVGREKKEATREIPKVVLDAIESRKNGVSYGAWKAMGN